ncbi:MAG: GAF domain-containing protein, partial [Prochloraceae cyanobacterium]|nr:GAF domain-containing protein [Prochloraceae cyanobacterium]
MEVKSIVPEDKFSNGSSWELKETQRDKIEQFKSKLFKQERERGRKILKQIRTSQDRDSFLLKTTRAIQEELQLSRVCIYRFDPQSEGQKGQVVAESLDGGWTPALDEILPCLSFGATNAAEYQSLEFVAIEDVEAAKLSAYQKQLLQTFQVQASLALPILVNDTYSNEDSTSELDQVWGLLVVQQCEQPRRWLEEEINLLSIIGAELTRRLQLDQPPHLLSQQKDILTTINQQMQIKMQDLVDKVRRLLKVERVLAYGFNPDWSGKVLAESVESNWQKAVGAFEQDYFLKGEQDQPYYIVNDIYAQDFAPCLIEALEKLQAKAYILVPIVHNSQLLGLLAAYQNSGPRNWQQSEVNLMLKLAPQLNFPLQQTAFVRQTEFRTKQLEAAFQREKDLKKMSARMRSAKDKQRAFQIATQEGRKILGVDRLAIYRFHSDWSGEFISESVAAGWSSLMKNIPIVQDTYLQENLGGRYQFGECFAVDDIYNVGHQSCHLELLEQFEARAYAIAPILLADQKLWGLVGAYQNGGVRKWQEEELEALREIATQLAIALQRIDYVEKLESRAGQEQALFKIVERIRQSLNLNEIFQTTTLEVRQLLKCDRVAIYRFHPDWSGEFIADSHGAEWVSLLEEQRLRPEIVENVNDCSVRNLASSTGIVGSQSAPLTDTYLQQTKGRNFSQTIPYRVCNDVYNSGFSDCYIRALEAYQAKAYIIIAIYQGQQLWGLLAAYQNSDSRNWKQSEVKLLNSIGSQLAVGVQQAEYAQKIETQSQQERAISTIVERIRQSLNLNEIFQTTTL